jgi:hypothetical protein
VQGSNIEVAINSASLLLKSVEGGVNYIIVMSDGGFEQNTDYEKIKEVAGDVKIISYSFGTEQGAPIPLSDGGFQKDGEKIVIRLGVDHVVTVSDKV